MQPLSGLEFRAPYGATGPLGWVESAVAGQAVEKGGAVILADINFRERSRHSFTNALITEVSFPASDAGAKDACALTVKMKADFQAAEPASGQLEPPPAGPEGWRRDRFKVAIDDLPQPGVVAVSPLTVTMTPAGPKPSHLVLYVAPASAKPFYEWQAAAPASPKGGSVAYLGSAGQVLSTLRLQGLQVIDVGPDPGADPPRVRVELAPKAVRFEGG
jgi:hypothetical protein